MYMVSTRDCKFGVRVLCPLSSCKSAQLRVMQQARGFSAFVSTVYKMWKKKLRDKCSEMGTS